MENKKGWMARAALPKRSKFRQHLDECADEVDTWPSYKREALKKPCPKCATCHDQGEVFIGPGKVESHMLEEPEPIYSTCPDCTQPSPVQGLDFSRPLETENGDPVKWICADVIEYKNARVCVDEDTGFVYSSPYIGLKIRNVTSEKAELPEVVAYQARDAEDGTCLSLREDFFGYTVTGKEPLMTVAQHEKIVRSLRFERQQMDRAFTTCVNERDAALARVAELESKLAELEKQEPLLHINPLVVDELLGRAKRSPGGLTWSKEPCGSWTLPLYTAPVIQSQYNVPEGWKLVPLEPTGEMIAAANANPNRHKEGVGHEYRAMLAAAPVKEVV